MTNRHNISGFTFVEALVGTSLTLMVGAGILGLIVILGANRVKVFDNYITVETTNSNISSIVREIRNAKPGYNGAYTLVVAEDHEIVFYSDVDFDGETERVRYTLEGTELIKGITEPVGFPATYDTNNEKVKVVAQNIINSEHPIFFYYNGDWPDDTENNPLPTPTRLSETKLMKISLKINKSLDTSDDDFLIESYVQLRGLKQNL